MSTPTVTRHSLYDYSALPALRQSIAAKATSVTITNIDTSSIDLALLLQQAEASASQLYRLSKRSLAPNDSPIDRRLDATLRALNALAAALFNNLSHVLELPWEKYLAEMHEYTAPGADELHVGRHGSDLANAWSTLTLLIDPSEPEVCHVVYGEALAVLSENQVSAASSLPLSANAGRCIAYYVRLNDTTYYTRSAGALMTPLTHEEYETRKFVKDLNLANA
ncbi:hypothetical protein EKO04_003939 [Ascochyta lentis]|uniref:Uncharacterized protein n=1 Tax=Ascochyta lentis TaxID=205686 RepID=A0A8H7J882_9PLEO|nr:hypothetical protein EKO04_003939 [Ascochyta lentis]